MASSSSHSNQSYLQGLLEEGRNCRPLEYDLRMQLVRAEKKTKDCQDRLKLNGEKLTAMIAKVRALETNYQLARQAEAEIRAQLVGSGVQRMDLRTGK